MRLLFFIGVAVWQVTCSNAIGPLLDIAYDLDTFLIQLIETIGEEPGANIILTQLNLGVALAMVVIGARGNTRARVQVLLNQLGDDLPIFNIYQSLVNQLTGNSDLDIDFGIDMENNIYLAQGLKPKAKFVDDVKTRFQSRIENIDFRNPAEAAKTINARTGNQTNNYIKDLVNEDDFTDATGLVLVNTVYCKLRWGSSLTWYTTKIIPFYVNGQREDLEAMVSRGPAKIGELSDIGAKFVELPYEKRQGHNDVSMIIIVPKNVRDVGSLVKTLKQVTIKRLFEGTHHESVSVFLPKFKIESTIDLKAPLTKLGLGEIFLDSADFSGIVDSPRLKVDKFVQRAVIDVNEEGSDFSAAGMVAMSRKSRSIDDLLTAQNFKVDGPFIAVIATKSGIPLLTSFVMKPTY